MLDKELVKNKLADLSVYYKKIKSLLIEDATAIIADDLKLHTAERLFQLIVDTSIDINTHLIAEMDLEIPDDYYNTFIALGENKVLPPDFALKIAPSVGLRNLVVHKYGKVDLRRMMDDIKNEIGDYFQYMKYIDEFIAK